MDVKEGLNPINAAMGEVISDTLPIAEPVKQAACLVLGYLIDAKFDNLANDIMDCFNITEDDATWLVDAPPTE